jgi:hypothetical protein
MGGSSASRNDPSVSLDDSSVPRRHCLVRENGGDKPQSDNKAWKTIVLDYWKDLTENFAQTT